LYAYHWIWTFIKEYNTIPIGYESGCSVQQTNDGGKVEKRIVIE